MSNLPSMIDGDTPAAIDSQVASLVNNPGSGTNAALSATYVPRVKASSWPLYAYGNSYTVLAQAGHSAGNHYLQDVQTALNFGTLTSYGVSGTRIIDALCGMVNQAPIGGCSAPVAGSKWPGTIGQRSGLIVIDSIFNDIGHYPDMTLGTVVPAALAGTNYRNGFKGMLRLALALASSDSRVEDSAATFTGTWTNNSPQAYASGGSLSFTSTVGSKASFPVTPPQTGPLAGKVHVLLYKLDPGTGAMAQVTIDVDGANAVNYQPAPWEQYKGQAGTNTVVAWDCQTVSVPVDGNSHVVNLTHSGSAGQYLYADCVLIPSVAPNPLAFMGTECPPNSGSTWTGAQVGVWEQNQALMIPDAKSVVSEFPNAFYVPSTMTSNGLYSGDGIHPNDRGHQQRANDLIAAAQMAMKAAMDNRALQLQSNSAFVIL